MHRKSLVDLKVPHPATSDNVAGGKYFKSWRELNFSAWLELFLATSVNVKHVIRQLGAQRPSA
jgi:hypothetical protein